MTMLMKDINVIHIIRDLDIASGGPSRSVPSLAHHQSKLKTINVIVIYQDKGNTTVDTSSACVKYISINTKNIFTINTILNSLPSHYFYSKKTIFHLHGLWSPFIHLAVRIATKYNIPYIISTRGMLAPWALSHKAYKKKIGWWLYQKNDIDLSVCLIATSSSEKKAILATSPQKKVHVIPNGCEEIPLLTKPSQYYPNLNTRWALAIGRLHPVKGYEELLHAWVKQMPKGWSLAIAGPNESGYRYKLEKLIIELKLTETVFLLGEVNDIEKWNLFEQAELFLAPSKTENFGMAIAESLQSGTPVITTTGTPWKEIRDKQCGWWITLNQTELQQALNEATQTSTEKLKAMGRNGKELISEHYSWSSVSRKTLKLYQSIIGES